jgi:predicted NBD/HSP70 family sugar kinase
MVSLGIDIGGSSVKLALIEQDGQAIWKKQSDPYTRPTRDQLAGVIRATLAGRFEARGATVGICVPGERPRDSHTVVRSIHIPSLEGLNLDDLVRQVTGATPAHTEVLADAVASAFDVFMTRRLSGRLCAIALGTGVGLGVIDDGGVPLRVDGDSAGHFGQMDVSIEGAPVIGPDGGAGSLEGYLGAPALLQRYGHDMETILARLSEDDPPMRALARAIRICHAIYRPRHVALVGGIGVRMAQLLGTIKRMVDRDLTRLAHPDWTLTFGKDEFHAAEGAARYAAHGGKLHSGKF